MHPFAVLRLGFRPMYLFAGAFATLGIPLWLLLFTGVWRPPLYFSLLDWHRHEMLFGYTVAVIAGFLLTAVRTWTGRPTLAGVPLGLLALLWLAARVLVFCSTLVPEWLIAAVDLAFLPLVALVIGIPIVATRNFRNLAMPLILLALAGANLLMHVAQSKPELAGLSAEGGRLGLDLVTLVMVVVGGRVIPFFTGNALPAARVERVVWADRAAIASVVLLVGADLLPVADRVVAALALCAAFLNAVRTCKWRFPATLRNPLLWILHLGYAWITLALALRGLSGLWPAVPPSIAVHAMTAGAIASLTLGMMTRTALGHTGRALQVSRGIVCSYLLVNVAALIRVLAPVVTPDHYLVGLLASALAWTGAFGLFTLVYFPILSRPRIDGAPG